MGYRLYIGEFHVDIRHKDRTAVCGVTLIDGLELGAPLNSSEHHKNECWPPYTAWHDFARDVGLHSVFFADGDRYPWFVGASGHEHAGLLNHHPGAVALHPDHRYAFYEARQKYNDRPEGHRNIWTVRRLDWLVWWTDWAMKNCDYPTFANG